MAVPGARGSSYDLRSELSDGWESEAVLAIMARLRRGADARESLEMAHHKYEHGQPFLQRHSWRKKANDTRRLASSSVIVLLHGRSVTFFVGLENSTAQHNLGPGTEWETQRHSSPEQPIQFRRMGIFFPARRICITIKGRVMRSINVFLSV